MFPFHSNESGSFQELAHSDDVQFGQLSILKVNPKCKRGGHYHTYKKEWFCCIRGECKMSMVNVTDGEERFEKLDGSRPEFVYISPYESHTVENTGEEVCEILIIISEKYDDDNPDTVKYGGK
jgi:dTDP-4-dehydrorhamnose 3,5-epimerase-like enzyme